MSNGTRDGSPFAKYFESTSSLATNEDKPILDLLGALDGGQPMRVETVAKAMREEVAKLLGQRDEARRAAVDRNELAKGAIETGSEFRVAFQEAIDEAQREKARADGLDAELIVRTTERDEARALTEMGCRDQLKVMTALDEVRDELAATQRLLPNFTGIPLAQRAKMLSDSSLIHWNELLEDELAKLPRGLYKGDVNELRTTLNELLTRCHEATFKNAHITWQKLNAESEAEREQLKKQVDEQDKQLTNCNEMMARATEALDKVNAHIESQNLTIEASARTIERREARINELLESNTALATKLRSVDRTQMVREFFVVARQDRPEHIGLPSEARLRLAMRLIAEEFFELFASVVDDSHPERWHVDALKRELDYLVNHGRIKMARFDWVECIDGCVDLGYVVEGLAIALGVDLRPMWVEVQRANMAKMGGPVDPHTGKQLKPEGWTPPDIEGELVKQGWTRLFPV